MSGNIRELAAKLGEDPRLGPGLRLRQGQVITVFFNDSVSITLAGSTAVIPSVRFVNGYQPVVGDIVWILQNGPDLLVLGKPKFGFNWTVPTLVNGWADYGAPFTFKGYHRNEDGWVSCQGLVTGGSVVGGSTVWTFPAGLRPATQQHFVVATNGSVGIINVYPDGRVLINASISAAWFSTDQIAFQASP